MNAGFCIIYAYDSREGAEQNMADWTLIKSEYISDPKASYRNLAKKYGVSFDTLKKMAKREDWPGLRTQATHTAATQILSVCVAQEVSQAEKIIQATDQICDRMIEALASMDISNATAVRQMALALKDIREIYNLNKTQMDKDEQQARIDTLKFKAHVSDDDETETGVVLLPVIEGELIPPDE